MGYNNEKAAINKFSELYDYCQKHVMEHIEIAFTADKKANIDSLTQELPFSYSSLNPNSQTPVVSFDGGLATLFPGELAETKIIKVAGACPPQFEDFFKDTLTQSYFHVLSGLLRWPKGADKDENYVIDLTINESLLVPELQEMLFHLSIPEEEYKHSMVNHLKFKRGNQVEDTYREILEWALIINFTEKMRKKYPTEKIPFVIVKDGSLYPYGKTVGEVLSSGIKNWLNNHPVPIVGVVKASRFVADDSAYRKVINQYLKRMKKNTFFQIPKKLEKKMEEKDFDYERYFFSIFGGKSVYEIQIPKRNIDDVKTIQEYMDILSSHVTFNYGGSISANSFAHVQASLAEHEARFLTNQLRYELNKEKNDKK